MLCRYHRIEVLGALASVLSSWLVTGILVYEAAQRIISPVKVNGRGTAIAQMVCSSALLGHRAMYRPVWHPDVVS